MRPCIVLLIAFSFAAAALACDYTVRDIGFVDFAPPKLKLVVLFSDGLGESELRDAQRKLAEQSTAPECRCWNFEFQSGTLANFVASSAAQQQWVRESQFDWSCWLVRGDGETRLITEANFEQQEPAWPQLLADHFQAPLSANVRENALQSFAQIVLFQSSDDVANARAEEAIAQAIETLDKAASLLPRPISLPVKVVRVDAAARDEHESLLWSVFGASGLMNSAPDWIQPEQPLAWTLYGRGRLAGPALIGDDIQLEGLLSQLVLVGQSCECGTERNWVQYPELPLAWPEEMQSDMARLLGFDPSNAVVIEEVKRIIQRGPQSLPNGRDDVNDVVQTTLAGGLNNSDALQATVIQGDGWDFEPNTAQSAPANLSGLTPKLLTIPPGRQLEQNKRETSDREMMLDDAAGVTASDTPPSSYERVMTSTVHMSTNYEFTLVSPFLLVTAIALGAGITTLLAVWHFGRRTEH